MFDYIYIFLILISPFIGKLIKNIYIIYKLKKEYVESTDILNYMCSLTKDEFAIWTCDFLYNNNFSNIVTCSNSQCHSQDIVCTKDQNTFYVLCKQTSSTESLTKDDIDSLLGSMVLDNIHKGIVVTTGKISKTIKDSLSSIPNDYYIQIISGDDLKYSINHPK